MTDSLQSLTPQRPTLYRLADDGQSLDFFFAQCPACSRLTFPANAPGCMHCGGPMAQAERVVRSGAGTLMECVTVHVPLVAGMVVPAVVGDVQLADGIVEEAVIEAADDRALTPGMPLRAVAVRLPDGSRYGCRFVPVQAEGGSAR